MNVFFRNIQGGGENVFQLCLVIYITMNYKRKKHIVEKVY